MPPKGSDGDSWKSLNQVQKDKRLAKAIAATLDLQAPNVTEIARNWDIPRQTLVDCLQGAKTRCEAHEKEQVLTVEQENLVAQWIKVLGVRGMLPPAYFALL
jgi:hypothetical protein